jgi:serine/threonine protein kinase/tetratricopeptide (TPR) repeat protein
MLMKQDNHKKLNPEQFREIFSRALEKQSPPERERYLDEACQGEPELRQQVESLLRAHEQAGEFLGQSVKLPLTTLVTERAGSIIGRYKLLALIGEGAFGAVWMAEQEEPVRRRVALKVIKPGMDTKQVLARFEAERQALAMMDHPSIARVLDGGATDSGRPYFVMELVRGTRITEYCDANKLPTRERLLLFIQVCQAVQHAHQKGIIHRDLKPSNILVTEVDGAPVPKVIDFGVAKATQARLTERTLFTGLHQMIGTPAYMSPEQAGLGALDMDTRSDIYALGVLLYELLTGQTPLATEKFEKAGLDEIFRLIREQEAPKPSTRLTELTGEQLTAVAERHQAEPLKLNRLLAGDLDWIVMKALEKDRRRRYETANGLASDLLRHLHNEPVTARPPSNLYRLQRAWRRNKAAFAASAAVVAALLAGFVVSTLLFLKEKEARQRASAAEATQRQFARQALVEAEKNRLSSEVMGKTFLELARAIYYSGTGKPLKSMFDQATARLENGSLADKPEAQAFVLSSMGTAYLQLDEFDKAEGMQRQSLALRRKALGDSSPEVADSLILLAEVLLRRGDAAGAESNYQAAARIDSRVWERNAEHLSLRGGFLAQHARWNEAADDFARAVAADASDYWNSYVLTPLLIQAGKIGHYQAHCKEMLAQFGNTTNPRIAEGTAKSCLLLPSAVGPDDLLLAARVAGNAVTLSKEGDWTHWRLMTKGLADYRQGRFTNALAMMGRSQKALTQESDGAADACEADTWFISAMARRQLKQPAEARADLNRGLELVQTKLPKLDGGDLGDQWFDFLTTCILMREAKATVEGSPAAEQSPAGK